MYHYVIDQNQDSMTSNNSIVGQNLVFHCKTKHFFFQMKTQGPKGFSVQPFIYCLWFLQKYYLKFMVAI